MAKMAIEGSMEIKPCPFCGLPAECFKYFNDYAVECTTFKNHKRVCPMNRLTATGHNRPTAIKNWNKRA